MERRAIINSTIALISFMALILLIILIIGILTNVDILSGGRPAVIGAIWEPGSQLTVDNHV